MNVATKKLLSILVVVAMVLSMVPAIALPAAAEVDYTSNLQFAEGTTSAKCPKCDKVVTWTGLTSDDIQAAEKGKALNDGHYYLASEIKVDKSAVSYVLYVNTGAQVCLHLNGNNLIHNVTGDSHYAIQNSGTLNIMGTGKVYGDGKGYHGGAVAAITSSNQVTNLYGGTYEDKDSRAVSAAAGSGTINVYAGATLNDMIQIHSSNSGTSVVNIYGGTINGIIGLRGQETSNGSTVNIYGGTFNTGKTLIHDYQGTVAAGAKTSLNIYGGDFNCTEKIINNATEEVNVKVLGGDWLFSPAKYADGTVSAQQQANGEWKVVDIATVDFKSGLQFQSGTTNAFCPACGSVQTWTELNGRSDYSGLKTGHYYLTNHLTLSGSDQRIDPHTGEKVCIHLNGFNLTNDSFYVFRPNNAGEVINVMGTGEVSGTPNGMHPGITTWNPGPVINLYSGVYKSTGSNDRVLGSRYGVNVNLYKDVTVEGGIACGRASTINVYGATVKGSIFTSGRTAASHGEGGGVIIHSGNFLADELLYEENYTSDGADEVKVTILGGTFAFTEWYAADNYPTMTPYVCGGTFAIDPSTYVMAGYSAAKLGETWKVVKPSVDSMKVYTSVGAEGPTADTRLNTTVYGLDGIVAMRIKFYDAAGNVLVEVYDSPENAYMTGAPRAKLNVSAMIAGDSGSWDQTGIFSADKMPVKAELFLNNSQTPALTVDTIYFNGVDSETVLTAGKWESVVNAAKGVASSHPFDTADKIRCEHCKQDIPVEQWIPLTTTAMAGTHVLVTSGAETKLATGHYYLPDNLTYNHTVGIRGNSNDAKICIHLNGFNLTNNGAEALRGWCEMAVMGNGNVTGNRDNGYYGGGVNGVADNAKSKTYLYGGTYTDQKGSAAVSYSVGGGLLEINDGVTIKGNVAIRSNGAAASVGTLNIKGGTIEGIIRIIGTFDKQNIHISGGEFTSAGGVFYEDASSSGACNINISGGLFHSDAAPTATSGGLWSYTGGAGAATPIITGGTFKTAVGELLSDGYCADRQSNGYLKVKTGQHSRTNIVGSDSDICASCGKLYGEAIPGMTTLVGIADTKYYANVADAVAAATSDYYVKIPHDCTLNLNNQVVTLDANGCKVTLEGTGIVYPMDTAADSYEGHGSWVVGEGVTLMHDMTNPVNGMRYITVNNTDTVAFTFRVNMKLNKVTLRPSTADNQMGIYYKAQISCDDALALDIASYGVVLSLNDMPGADFLEESDNGFTTIEEKLDVNAKNGFTVETNSGAVFGIMKSGLTPEENAQRGEMNIYANAYIAIDVDNDGIEEVFMADTETGNADDVAWSLLDVMEAIEAQWDSYASVQSTVKAFYQYWAPLGMRAWEDKLPKIAAA